MRVKVHVEGLKGSGVIEKGEEPSALLNGVLEVDGVLIEEVGTIEVIFAGGDFVTVKPHLMPGAFEVVTHDRESWPRLIQEIDEARAMSGASRLIAATEGVEHGTSLE